MRMDYDVVVAGLGIMGAAATAELARRGLKVLGLDAVHPGHAQGSSHGDSRLIRLGYFEDPSYVPLLHRAYENWRRLESELDERLLFTTGVLHLGRHDGKVVQGTRKACVLHGLDHEELSASDVRKRFPLFSLADDEIGLFEPQGGYLLPEAALAGYLKLATRHGAALRYPEKVLAVDADDKGVTVKTSAQTWRARKIVIATGSWISQLVPALRAAANPIRQVVAWLRPEGRARDAAVRMPVFLREEGGNGSYFGFPMIGSQGLKIGKHAHFRESLDPDQPNQEVSARDLALLSGFAQRYLTLADTAPVEATTCRYTLLPTENFLLDLLPDRENVIVASPCSGHGFKFASVVGEILADLAQHGATDLPIGLFSFNALHGPGQA